MRAHSDVGHVGHWHLVQRDVWDARNGRSPWSSLSATTGRSSLPAWRATRRAFDEIVARHRRSVYQVCFRFTNNHEDASDLAQEAFVRAWKGLGSFKGEAALSTWLYRIAVNVCLNRVGAKKAEKSSPLSRIA